MFSVWSKNDIALANLESFLGVLLALKTKRTYSYLKLINGHYFSPYFYFQAYSIILRIVTRILNWDLTISTGSLSWQLFWLIMLEALTLFLTFFSVFWFLIFLSLFLVECLVLFALYFEEYVEWSIIPFFPVLSITISNNDWLNTFGYWNSAWTYLLRTVPLMSWFTLWKIHFLEFMVYWTSILKIYNFLNLISYLSCYLLENCSLYENDGHCIEFLN